MLPFLIVTALVGLGLSMDLATTEDADGVEEPFDLDRLERDDDPADTNPFKVFAKMMTKRAYHPGASHLETYEIRFPDPPNFNVSFVVDGSWPGNQKEPYEIVDKETTGNLEFNIIATDFEDCSQGLENELRFTGSTDQNIYMATGAEDPKGLVVVNKTSGQVIQTTNLNLSTAGQDLNINDGDWNMAGFDLTVNNDLNIGDGTGAASSARLPLPVS